MGALDLVNDQLHKSGTLRGGEFVNLEFSIVIGISRLEALLDDNQWPCGAIGFTPSSCPTDKFGGSEQ
jgi:hypothetical protein